MAAFTGTPVNSPFYARQIGVLKADSVDQGGTVQATNVLYTHLAAQGSGTGEINLIQLPAGHIYVYPDLSRLVTSQFGSSATLSIGWRAYVDYLGATVAVSAAGLHSVGAAGAGALDVALALPAAGIAEFNSRDGVVIFGTVASGNIDADDTIWLNLVFSRLR